MKPTDVVFNKANKLISKKKEALLISHINTALDVIHETEYFNILDYLKDKGVNLVSIYDSPTNSDKIKVYHTKKGTVIGCHSHEFTESYICLFGKMKVHLNDQSHIIDSFKTFKVEKLTVHSVEFLEDTFLVVFAE